MSIILAAYIPALLGMSFIAYLVFVQRSRAVASYSLFCTMLVLVVLWLLAQMASLFMSTHGALFALRLSFIFSNFMLAVLLMFAIVYLKKADKINWSGLTLLLLPALLLSFVAFLPDVYRGVENNGIRQVIETGFLYDIQSAYLVTFSVLSIVVIYRKMRHLHGVQKRGVAIMLAGFVVPIIVNVTVNYVFRVDTALVQYFWPTSFLVMTSLIAYAMIRHGLFDIKLAAVRSGAYALSVISLGAVYYVIAYFLSVVLFQGEVSSAVSISPINIALALVLAFIFQPIKNFFDRVTDRIFYRDRYSVDEFYAKLNEVLTSTTDLRGLLETTARQIGGMLKSEQALFIIQYNDVHRVTAGTPHHTSLSEDDLKHLNTYVEKNGSNLIVTELLPDDDAIRRLLTRHKIAILMPLTNRGVILGYLALGDQLTGNYNNRDVKVLNTVSNELVIAIQNSLSVQEVRDINVHLQERINAATKELKASNTQLKRLDETKDEFLSMASHQLRTPLTSVKGFLSMVLDGDMGSVTPQQRKVLEQAFESSQRMVFLIGDFLNVSRIQSGKFVIDKSVFDIVKLVHEEVNQLKDSAKARGLEFVYDPPAGMPQVFADKDKLRQVMMNFMDNALYYSPNGGKVTIKLYKDASGIVFKVSDTGIGVPKAQQEKLFTKFFRADNAREQRPDGTGIGLYMAKKVIVGHEGSLIFESKEGKGSTFGFHLPLEKAPEPVTEEPEIAQK